MNKKLNRIAKEWIFFFIILIFLLLLFALKQLDSPMSKVKEILSLIPAVFVMILFVIWIGRSEKGKFAKVLIGIFTSVCASVFFWYNYIDQVFEWLSEKSDLISEISLAGILVFSFIQTIIARRTRQG
ncbi:hypothetical protein [Sediminibacterium ginsengisoli]|uniref:Uncharacterized protein n=1 Tax=Sediminibacterium ginsengisoli TaxID=413434 RepID=A0A1T4JPB8_9BACT|nr:hypothetical protein [Sediminibacterium ginsengisoli]SJZ32018.1 hypothetical protein SAMN04488132_10124 [Sediminibacterium ginsengisoli]